MNRSSAFRSMAVSCWSVVRRRYALFMPFGGATGELTRGWCICRPVFRFLETRNTATGFMTEKGLDFLDDFLGIARCFPRDDGTEHERAFPVRVCPGAGPGDECTPP